MIKIPIVLLAFSMPFLLSVRVMALSAANWFSIENNSIYYDGSSGSAGTNSCSNIGPIGAAYNGTPGVTVWTRIVPQPYYLEEFAINVLEDLANATNTPVNSAVTSEHVLALVAWFWEEGGNIANNDKFNPLNSSLPEGNNSTITSTGDEAYDSFDVGVTATTQTLLGGFQSRIAGALLNPSTSAEQVMYVITYFQDYLGNLAWAGADTPGSGQTNYYNNLLANVEQARLHYNHEASTELGPFMAQYNYPKDNVSYSDLVYRSFGSNGIHFVTTSNTGQCPIASSPNPITVKPVKASSSNYQNPLRSVSQLVNERVDQGVDYSGQGPVYAIGDGIVTNTNNSGWPAGNFTTYRLISGPAKNLYVYVAEDCTPAVSIGETVTSSTVLCNMYEGSSGIETGWALPPGNGLSEARFLNQWNGTNSTAMGQNFSQLLQSLGAEGGIINAPVEGSLPSGWPTWQ